MFHGSNGLLSHKGKLVYYDLELKEDIADPAVFDGLVMCVRSTSKEVSIYRRIDDGKTVLDLPNVRLFKKFLILYERISS